MLTIVDFVRLVANSVLNLAKRLEDALASNHFMPIMAGIGEGGLLAEQVLSAAPSNTIAGAVLIDPLAELEARFNPCPHDPTVMHDRGLLGFWTIGTATQPSQTIQSILLVPRRRAGVHVDAHEFPVGTPAREMLLALSRPYFGPRAPDEEDVGLAAGRAAGRERQRYAGNCDLAMAVGAIWTTHRARSARLGVSVSVLIACATSGARRHPARPRMILDV